MFVANGLFSLLQGDYLFAEIDKRAKAFKAAHPDADLIRMGIGDVTRPLVPAVVEAMHRAVDDMSRQETFHGYPPYEGYEFLRTAIRERDYAARNVDIGLDEIFVSDGAKGDVANLQELFSADAVVAVMDPVYPVYVAANVLAGRAGKFDPDKGGFRNIVYLPATAENGFCPPLPTVPVDVLYLCFPNNPTGAMLTRDQLKVFVDYAVQNHVLLIYDSAYEAYIAEPDIPHSIYEIEGARKCAIECRSMSKTAGFTGTRCAYTVVPRDLVVQDEYGNDVSLRNMWLTRASTKYNGVSYITQRGAEAAYLDPGYSQILGVVRDYMENARIMREGLVSAGYTVFGGVNAPYVWVKVPGGDSWAFFDQLLSQYHILGTPGAGFGNAGEGYLRMTAFATRENTLRAMERMHKGGI